MCGSRAVITALEGRQREPGAEGEREGGTGVAAVV